MAHAQKPDFVFRRNRRVHLNWWGRQFSQLVAVEECESAGSNCIIFSKYTDHSSKMSLGKPYSYWPLKGNFLFFT